MIKLNKSIKILAFAATNSSRSINLALARYAASLVEGAIVDTLDLNDFEMPIFSEDREKKIGHPSEAKVFLEKIAQADALIIAFAEHNGNFTAAYKNLFDWCSRVNREVYQNKPTLILSTSPGARGGISVLELALDSLPRFSADVKASLSVPSYYQNLNLEQGPIVSEDINDKLFDALKLLLGY
jgi:chromate reductase, NAD(P)H dehydrogenase (quinone)